MANGLPLMLIALIMFVCGYWFYGRFIFGKFKLDDSRVTPAHEFKDGVDYVPAKKPVLLGHHFASIAGAAPIVGPVLAGGFGWLPVYVWIIFGGIFLGAVHDFSSLIASVRHRGQSIGTVIEQNIGIPGKKLFVMFAWATLILIIAAFLVVVSRTFVAHPEVATTSILFIFVAVLFGFFLYKANTGLVVSTIVGVILLGLCIFIGMKFPLSLSQSAWVWILLGYILVASVTPVWILLQPRDYLNSFILYILLFGAAVGLIIARPDVKFDTFTGFSNPGLGPMFPILFVTVACGAISGFHSIVAGGTTAKQVDKESDTKIVGYGGMLIESFLAIIAIITVAILTQQEYSVLKEGGPVAVFADGVGGFISRLGLPLAFGISFAALAVSAFALTTLDTATRLARFLVQEFFTSRETDSQFSLMENRYLSTILCIIPAGALALSGQWTSIWPLFGAANQLLAALALLAVTIWLKNKLQSNWFTKIPMVLMYIVSITALFSLIWKNYNSQNYIILFCALALLGVAVSLAFQGYKSLTAKVK